MFIDSCLVTFVVIVFLLTMNLIIDVHLSHNQHKHYTAGGFLDRDKDLMVNIVYSIIIIIRLIQNSNERL